jgi:CcmD family protein
MASFCTLGSGAELVSLSQPGEPAPSGNAEAPQERSQAFKPVTGGPEMQSGEMLLVEAYAAIWLLAFGLILASLRRQRKLDDRIKRLEDDLDKARAGSEKPASNKKKDDA